MLTRPNIAFLVNKFHQFLQAPTYVHLIVAKQILRFLKVSVDHGITFHKCIDFTIIGFYDSD